MQQYAQIIVDITSEKLDRTFTYRIPEALAGQIVLDIRHPDAAEDEPLQLDGVEVQALPFYALNNRFKELDETRQYLLYCDRGVMSRLHAHHLLSEGHANVRVYRPH